MLSVSEAQMMAWLGSFLLPLFRVLGLMTSAPVLSNASVPRRARVGIALVVTLGLSGVIDVPPGIDIAGFGALLLFAREAVIGLLIGFVAQLIFAAFEMAGEVIGLQMGLSYASFFDPGFGSGNPVGRLLNNFSMLTFLALNGPLVLIAAIAQSFHAFPIGNAPIAWQRFDLIAMGGDLLATGLSVALPFVILLLFLNTVLGVISRVAPQLNAMAVGFPVTIGAGLFLLASGFPLIEPPLTHAMERLMAALG